MTHEGNHEHMNTIVLLLQKVLPVFLVLFLGMLCRRKNLLTREGINALKKVAVDIALPAVMFSAFATAEYSVQSICVPLTIFSLCLVALFLGFQLCRRLKISGRLSPFLAAGFEAGMLGCLRSCILTNLSPHSPSWIWARCYSSSRCIRSCSPADGM